LHYQHVELQEVHVEMIVNKGLKSVVRIIGSLSLDFGLKSKAGKSTVLKGRHSFWAQ